MPTKEKRLSVVLPGELTKLIKLYGIEKDFSAGAAIRDLLLKSPELRSLAVVYGVQLDLMVAKLPHGGKRVKQEQAELSSPPSPLQPVGQHGAPNGNGERRPPAKLHRPSHHGPVHSFDPDEEG